MTSHFIKGDYRVTIAGQDVTDRFRPLLLNMDVDCAAGEATDRANLALADPDGRIAMPQDRSPVLIHLNGISVFEGFVAEVSCSASKHAGRQIQITASSADQGSKAKQPSLRHKDDATLADVAKEFGAKADLTVQVLGSLAGLHRVYWLQQNESFISWGQRIAREVGGTFKVIGTRAFLSPRNEGLSASGKPLTPIAAAFGDNLIEGNIAPIISRPKYSKVALSYFDRGKGERIEIDVDTGIADVETKLRSLITVANEAQARKKGEALGKESDREKGSGSITVLGDPRAQPEATCTVSGFRPGIDGVYRIDAVKHSVTKGDGFTTTLDLRQPKGGAGVDGR